MPWYQLVKIVHYLGLIALMGAFTIYPRAGARLRASQTFDDARGWLSMLERPRGMFHGGSAMSLLSGMAMAGIGWRGPYPFITIGMVTLLAMWIIYGLTVGRHLRAVSAALDSRTGPMTAEASRAIHEPGPWTAMFALNIATLGVLLEMVLRLEWIGGAALVVGGALLGTLIGSRVVRAERKADVARAAAAAV